MAGRQGLLYERRKLISSFDVDAATRKKSCGRALNKRLLEEDLTDLVQEGVVRLQGLLENKGCEGGLY